MQLCAPALPCPAEGYKLHAETHLRSFVLQTCSPQRVAGGVLVIPVGCMAWHTMVAPDNATADTASAKKWVQETLQKAVWTEQALVLTHT